MKSQLFTVVALVLVAKTVTADTTEGSSTAKPLDGHDKDSITSILTDKEKMEAYMKCVLSKGPCSESSQRLKAITQNAMGEECSKCDDKQKTLLAHMAVFVSQKLPAEWEQMKETFDPKKEHRKYIDDLVAKGKVLQAAMTTPTTGAAPTTPKA